MDLLAKRSFIRMQKDITRMQQCKGGTISHFSKSYRYSLKRDFYSLFLSISLLCQWHRTWTYIICSAVRIYLSPFLTVSTVVKIQTKKCQSKVKSANMSCRITMSHLIFFPCSWQLARKMLHSPNRFGKTSWSLLFLRVIISWKRRLQTKGRPSQNPLFGHVLKKWFNVLTETSWPFQSGSLL